MLTGPDRGEKLALLARSLRDGQPQGQDLGACAAERPVPQTARFADLLNAVVRDPAMIYLDSQSQRPRQRKPGSRIDGTVHCRDRSYSEADVKEAAGDTGWTVNEGAFKTTPAHDDGEKRIISKTGKWTGDDLVKMLLEHPRRRNGWPSS